MEKLIFWFRSFASFLTQDTGFVWADEAGDGAEEGGLAAAGGTEEDGPGGSEGEGGVDGDGADAVAQADEVVGAALGGRSRGLDGIRQGRSGVRRRWAAG